MLTGKTISESLLDSALVSRLWLIALCNCDVDGIKFELVSTKMFLEAKVFGQVAS